MKYSILVVFITTFFSGFSVAQPPFFSVSPKVCVVSEQQGFCDLDLQFEWQLNAYSDVCLYQQERLLQCWEQQLSGQFNYKARVQVETIYSLINPHTGVLLAKTQVEVQSAHAKKNRRRLRSPWSFF
ncbi:DUF3019 domain-containing protein [Pseudoalteromonas sp. NSLLW218]|uniref:DUF3019 domain-containing protein n=1 Tax=Pseudoalteromonas sp. NSLLW218 TaxID=2792048 RepID=UPI0018CFB2CF|nr:DUF3019 domain-containing protein [Pseudoalteromonas sp. NSLLW218]MBH0089817.1 DUF3019 domain-containing protein [Pseudoalteromonas sp. NSLLW218]